MYTDQKKEMEQLLHKKEDTPNQPHYIKDVMDEILEQVLKNGGDVQFVDKRVLDNYEHTAHLQVY